MIAELDADRLLPFPVRMYRRESPSSYTQRLLDANHCNQTHQNEMILAFQKRLNKDDHRNAWAHAVAAKTGRHTLISPAHEGRWMAPNPSDARLDVPEHARYGCTLCTHGQTIVQRPHFDDIVCIRHHRWLGLWGGPDDQRRVPDDTVHAQILFAKLRRKDRITPTLYRITARAVAMQEHPDLAIEDAEPLVFATTVKIINAITNPVVARQLLTTTTTFAQRHDVLTTALTKTSMVGPEIVRALWAYLHHTIHGIQKYAASGTWAPTWTNESLPASQQLFQEIMQQAGALQPMAEYFTHTDDTPAKALHLIEKLNNLRAPGSLSTPLSHTCANGHTFDYLPPEYDVTTPRSDPSLTPACGRCVTRRIEPRDDFASVRPDLVPSFDLHRNGGITAADIASGSKTLYWWICSSGHSHRAAPFDKSIGSERCSIESNKTLVLGINTVLDTHPEAANSTAETWGSSRSPAQNFSGSKIIVEWCCVAGHTFRARYWEVTSGKIRCTKCPRTRTFDAANSLASRHPELARLWHPTRNDGLTPADVTPGERRIVWWQCAKGHSNQARIDRRAAGQKCGICSSRRLQTGQNDLATMEPRLSLEYFEARNILKASEIFPSDHKLWWKCLKHGHQMEQTTQHRRSSQGCTRCALKERILKTEAAA
jgi:hypothetical protein